MRRAYRAACRTRAAAAPAWTLRPAAAADLPGISRLYFDTVHQVNARDYRPAQLRAWAPRVYPDRYWLQRWRTRQVWVAAAADGLLGFVEYRPPTHLDCLYVASRCQRCGCGSALLQRVVEEARTCGVRSLAAEVSLTARPFFLARGFRLRGRRRRRYRSRSFLLWRMRIDLREARSGAPGEAC